MVDSDGRNVTVNGMDDMVVDVASLSTLHFTNIRIVVVDELLTFR